MRIPLTEREAAFVTKIATDQYMDGNPAGSTWTFSVCESAADKALLGSLVKKGYASTNGESCCLTSVGVEFAKKRIRAAQDALVGRETDLPENIQP